MISSCQTWELLRAYVDRGDERAFAQLVAAHVDLVYSAAVRQVYDRQMAEDVCQGVFILLADKAPSMRADVILPAYLLRATYYVARNANRRELRRRRHERKAAAMVARALPNDVSTNLADVLDEGMNHLNERDRAAIVLRFFEQRSLAEAGAALGVSEDAAAMRVSRALGKLRRFFAGRNIMLNAVEVGTILSAIAVRPAPPHVAATAAAAATLPATATATATAAELARCAGQAMAREKVRALLYWSAAAAAVLIVIGLLCHLTYAFNRPRPMASPPFDVW